MPRARVLPVLFLLILGGHSLAQTAPCYYVESWSKGHRSAASQQFLARVTAAKPHFERRVPDNQGRMQFEFSLEPEKGPDGGIIAWHALLTARDDPKNRNLLARAQGPDVEFQSPKDFVWWFSPAPNAVIPIAATRIIRVEAFVVTLRALRTRAAHDLLTELTLEITISRASPEQAPTEQNACAISPPQQETKAK